MAGEFTFHNKFHRSNHHTLTGTGIVDAGLDPIATYNYPFKGIFYNTLIDTKRTFNISTNSYDWWSAHTTLLGNSANWMLTRSVYSTVSSLSDNWNLGFDGYTTLKDNSGRYDSVFTTVCSFSAEWGSPYLMFTNKAQEYTHSKTFSGQDLILAKEIDPDTGESTDIVGLSTYGWNLDDQQIAFIQLVNKDIRILDPDEDTMIDGGLYTLIVKQPQNSSLTYDVLFDNGYRFSNKEAFRDIINFNAKGITIINFIAIRKQMYGDVTYLSGGI